MSAAQDRWNALSEQLLRFVRRRVADRAAAQDIAQETLARTFVQFSDNFSEAVLPRWAFRVARNLIVDHYRRKANWVPLENDEAIQTKPLATDDARALDQMLGSCASAMLARLEPVFRQAVTLADLQGVNQQEMAARLGVSISGMKSRVQRGRAKLRGMLLDCCQIDFDRRGNVGNCQRTERSEAYCAG